MARRPGPSLRALLFGCGAGAVLGSRPWPAGPVRLSGPCCLAVAQAPFWVRQLGFLVGSESNVRHSRPWPAGPCCLAVAQAPFWVRQLGFSPATGSLDSSLDRSCAERKPAPGGHEQGGCRTKASSRRTRAGWQLAVQKRR